MNRYLVTGAAGFIGANVALALLDAGCEVVGVDSVNDYYDVDLKQYRLNSLLDHSGFSFVQGDMADSQIVDSLFAQQNFDCVIHLAAQAGVRYSLENPSAYIQSNIVGFQNLIEACREKPPAHFVFASSSSVYGNSDREWFSETDPTDTPVSLYAATKKSNEMVAHTYAHLHGLPATGLRFFTVYGPYGRPDMAYYLVTKAILSNEPIKVFNNGEMRRDFTYIDDIVEGLVRIIESPAKDNYKIYNIGNHRSEQLGDFIATLEKHLGKTAKKELLPMQPGDVSQTYAEVSDLIEDYGYAPNTSIDEGLKHFVQWYLKSKVN